MKKTEKIEYRRPDRKERGTIYNIIADALSLDKFVDDDAMKVDVARWIYWTIMEKHACIRVARTRDSIVGFVAAVTEESRVSAGTWLQKTGVGLWLRCHKEGRKMLKLYKELEEGRKEFAAKPEDHAGHLAVFWIAPTYKGKQIEEELMKRVREYFAEYHITEMRAVLNNFSDLSFYQKNGFEKVGGQKLMIEPKGQRFRLNQEVYVKKMD